MEDNKIFFGTPDQSSARAFGFGVEEFHDQRHYCWMIGNKATILFYLAEPARVSVLTTVKPFTPPGKPLQRLEISCNDVSAGDHVLPLQWSDQSYPIPDYCLKTGWNTLTIECRYTFVPAQERGEGEEGDNRQLGVAFEKVLFQKQSFAGIPLPDRDIQLHVNDNGEHLLSQSPGTSFSTYRYLTSETQLLAECSLSQQSGIPPIKNSLEFLLSVTSEDGHQLRKTAQLSFSDARQSALLTLDLTSLSDQLVRIDAAIERSDMHHQQIDCRGYWNHINLTYQINRSKPADNRQRDVILGSRQDLIVILIDTLRSSALGCYGNPYDTSPNLDRFSRKSLLYSQNRAQASWTRPSVASLFTGLFPGHHGVQLSGSCLSEQVPRFIGNLQASGYHTIAVSTNPQISRHFGFAHDFDQFIEVFNGVQPEELRPELLDRLINVQSLITTIKSLFTDKQTLPSPFFMYIHIMDPHSPYNPPEPYSGVVTIDPGQIHVLPSPPRRQIKNRNMFTDEFTAQTYQKYLGEVRFSDNGIRTIFSLLNQNSSSIAPLVIVTGDHGEEFWEHGGMGHGRWVFEETLKVPLIIGPISKQVIIERNMEVRQILGSVLNTDKMIAHYESNAGKSLYFADELAGKDLTFWHSVSDGVYKCSVRTRDSRNHPAALATTLFNLSDDPSEQKDLAGKGLMIEGYLVEQLMKKIEADQQNRFSQPIHETDGVNSELKDQLQILGYTS